MIGEVIRKYRKEKGLTQEEMAGYLGVTAPAVNKWENHNSYPDITLLAPIARLLEISTDTLLSYKEEVTEQEIEKILEELRGKMKREDYDTVFRWAEAKIQEYPNCEELVLYLAQALDGYRTLKIIGNAKQYDEKICKWYERLQNSSKHSIAEKATGSLFHLSVAREEYEKAERFLNQIPERKFDLKQGKALLCQKQGKQEEAYRLYEELVFAGYNQISLALTGMYIMSMEEENFEMAEYISAKRSALARDLDMGRYMEVSVGMDMAVRMKDKEKTLQILTDMFHSVKDLYSFHDSPLYSHLKFSEMDTEQIADIFQRGIEDAEELEFIRNEPGYLQLLNEMKNTLN